MNQSKKGYGMRSWLLGFVASVIGLLTGVWMGVGMWPTSLLASESGFMFALSLVEKAWRRTTFRKRKGVWSYST